MRLSVCVYCGSRYGHDPDFADAARDLGRAIGAEGWRLVYGAGDVGLMGEVARAAQAAGADTFGVIPDHLLRREVGKTDLTRFIVTETMHERKKVMVMNADAIVILPGGAGTLDEFFEALTWRQLGLIEKPIFILNINGFWAKLAELVEHVTQAGFAGADLHSYYEVCPSVDTLLAALRRLRSLDSVADV